MAKRRYLGDQQKLPVLEDVDGSKHGEVSALGRRGGNNTSHLTRWRREPKRGAQGRGIGKKRGSDSEVDTALVEENKQPRVEHKHLRKCVAQAETTMEVQEKSYNCVAWGTSEKTRTLTDDEIELSSPRAWSCARAITYETDEQPYALSFTPSAEDIGRGLSAPAG
jgi:transposase-like protein